MNDKTAFRLIDLLSFLPENHQIIGPTDRFFNKIKPLGEADETSLGFIDPRRSDKQALAEKTTAGFLLVDFEIEQTEKLADKTLIFVENPKLTFTLIGNALFVKRPAFGIHPTAFVHPEAEIHPESFIGAFSYIGKSKIGRGTIIYSHVSIYDNVLIDENCIIHANSVLGSDGFGYEKMEDGLSIQFPHVGSIVIEKFVEIGSNTSIDLGSLGATRIGYGTKIDNLVHIGHNVQIGKCCLIAAHATIAGSTRVGDFSEIWMGAAIADGSKIGLNSSIGIGAVVIKEVPENKKVFGNPARVFSDHP